MNILDLEIGDICLGEDGTEYRILGDSKERNAWLGVIPVRIAIDQHGKRHKFIRGIEVKLKTVAPPPAHRGGEA